MGGLEAGQIWYIQFHKRNCVVEREVTHVSKKTVLLKDLNCKYPENEARYVVDELIFVEKVL